MSIVLAANNFGDNSPAGQAGPLGLLVIVLLGIACWFLYRSLSKHLRRIPASFDPEPMEQQSDRAESGGPGGPASADGAEAPHPNGAVVVPSGQRVAQPERHDHL